MGSLDINKTFYDIKNIMGAEFVLEMDLSPIRQNFEKNRNRQKFHHSLKDNPMFSKIAKFGCKML